MQKQLGILGHAHPHPGPTAIELSSADFSPLPCPPGETAGGGLKSALLLAGTAQLRSADFSPLPCGPAESSGGGLKSALLLARTAPESTAVHPGTIPLDGRGRIVVRRSAYPTSLILLAGPTGVGKSAVALALAERLDGEIISVDSMQVYRGLDIGTAKPTAQERQRVPHHLIDVVEVNQSFDAAQFMRLARAVAADIRGRGRLPILCGGTGLYFMAFLEGFGEAPPANATLRADLEATPLPGLLRELEQRDPVIFARIDRNNPRRVMRAVEVIRLTGRPFSAQRISWNRKGGAARTEQGTGERELFFGLARSKPDLHARIDSRVDEMFARGLVRETEQLLQRGLAENRTAMQAIGYRQVVELLRGERSLADTVALVKQRTRQLAKRQMTWFRGQFDIEWTELEPETGPDEIAERLLKHQEEDPTV